eukprot:1736668-Rhodomonas_salina.2
MSVPHSMSQHRLSRTAGRRRGATVDSKGLGGEEGGEGGGGEREGGGGEREGGVTGAKALGEEEEGEEEQEAQQLLVQVYP